MIGVAIERPPTVLQLLGNEIRWRVVRQLALSDRRVNELVHLIGERQNLVSYHLGLLRRSGLVRERRSSDDARDVYYNLDFSQVERALGDSLRGLHPALGTPRRRHAHGPGAPSSRVLFACTGNSARSLIAEAILRHATGGWAEVASAGPCPAGVHPLTWQVLAEREIPTKGLRSKALDEVAGEPFDYVITLCDRVRERCDALTGGAHRSHWSLADPALMTDSEESALDAFRATVSELEARISYFLPLLALSGPARR